MAGCHQTEALHYRYQHPNWPVFLETVPADRQNLSWSTIPAPCVYGSAFGLPRGSSRRQCRTHPVMAPQSTLSAALGGPHNVRQCIIRWQRRGIPRRAGQAVRVGLGAAGRGCWCLTVFVVYLTYPPTTASSRAIEEVNCVIVSRHLLHGESRGLDSAGHTRSWPRSPRQPPDQTVRIMYASA